MAALALVWDLIARDSASPAFARVGAAADGAAAATRRFLEGMSLVAAGAIIGESIKKATEFQASMTMIGNLAGAAGKQVATMGDQVLALSGKVAQSPEELATSLYHMASVGLQGKQAMDALTIASEGARIGRADLEQTTNALTATIASGIAPNLTYAQAMGKLLDTVGGGDMKMQDLNDSLSTGLLVTMKQYGISLDEVSAGLQVFGDNNIRGQLAATDFRMAVQGFFKVTQQGDAILQKFGLTQAGLAKEVGSGPDGLVHALDDLRKHFEDNGVSASQFGDLITEIFGKRAGVGMLVLLGELDRFHTKLNQNENESTSFADKWAAVTHTASFQFASLKDSVDAVGIKLGTALLPPLSEFAGWLTAKGIPAVEKFFGEVSTLSQDVINSPGFQAFWSGLQTAWNYLVDAGKLIASVVVPAVSALVQFFNSLPGPVQVATVGIVAFNLALKAGWFSSAGAGEAAASAGIIRRSVAGIGTAATTAATATTTAVGRMKAAYAEAAAAAEASAQAQAALWGEAGASRLAAAVPVSNAALWAPLGGAAATETEMAASRMTRAMAGVRGAASDLATRGFGAVSKAGAALFSLMGGPWGLALLGGVALWSQYSQGVDQVKQAIDSAKTSGEELFNTYVKLGTVYGMQADAARQTVINQQAWAQAALDNGVSQDTLTAALQGNAAAQKQVEQAAEKSSAQQSFSQGVIGAGLDALSGKMRESGNAATAFFNSMGANIDAAARFDKAVDDTVPAMKDYQDAAKKYFGDHQGLDLANQGVSTLQQGMDELAQSSGDTQKSLQGITDILKGLTGQGVSAAQAQVDLTTATIDTTKAFADMSKGALDAKGNIDLNSQSGVDLFNSLKNVASGFDTAVNDAYNYALATGSVGDAQKAAGITAETLYNKFLLTAEGAGMNEQAAKDLAKQLGLVPGDIVTQFLTPGLNAAQAGVGLLQGQVDVITASPHEVVVQGLTQQAEDALSLVGLHVRTLPDGTVKIDADTYAAQSALDAFIRANSTKVITVGIAGRQVAEYTGTSIIVNGKQVGMATGGLFRGAGTGTSDSNLIAVSDGEFIVNAAATQANKTLLHAINSGKIRGFADGGFVGIPGPWSDGSMTFPAGINPAGFAAVSGMIDRAFAVLAQTVYGAANAATQPVFSSGALGVKGGSMRALGQQIAAAMGYAAQFGAIDYIFSHESGWNPTAQNPTSTAYGIPQFLNSTWAAYGGKTSDPATQIRDGIEYMRDRYGSPNAAASFWAAHHWYDGGGWLPPGATMAMNGTGKPERVLTSEQWNSVNGPRDISVRVFIGETELTDMVRVVAQEENTSVLTALHDGIHY